MNCTLRNVMKLGLFPSNAQQAATDNNLVCTTKPTLIVSSLCQLFPLLSHMHHNKTYFMFSSERPFVATTQKAEMQLELIIFSAIEQ
jgi:hypothetical protein